MDILYNMGVSKLSAKFFFFKKWTTPLIKYIFWDKALCLECTFAVRLVIARKVHFLNVYRAKTCRNTHTAVGSWEVSPVLQGETRQLCPIVKPFKLQGPAALSHAGENHTVPFQVDLGCHRLHLEVGWYIIWREKERERDRKKEA